MTHNVMREQVKTFILSFPTDLAADYICLYFHDIFQQMVLNNANIQVVPLQNSEEPELFAEQYQQDVSGM